MHVIIGAEYGLWYGELVSHDIATRTAVLKNVRNIRYWYGGTGGITTLAAWGPKDSPGKTNRIGAAIPSATIQQVSSVLECTSDAVGAFAAIVPTNA